MVISVLLLAGLFTVLVCFIMSCRANSKQKKDNEIVAFTEEDAKSESVSVPLNDSGRSTSPAIDGFRKKGLRKND